MDNFERFLSGQSWHQLLYLLRGGFFEDRGTLSIVRDHVNLRFINNFLLMSADEIAWCERLRNEIELKGSFQAIPQEVVEEIFSSAGVKEQSQEISSSPSLLNYTRSQLNRGLKFNQPLPTKNETLRSTAISNSTAEHDDVAENRVCVECLQDPLPSSSRSIPKCPHRDVKIITAKATPGSVVISKSNGLCTIKSQAEPRSVIEGDRDQSQDVLSSPSLLNYTRTKLNSDLKFNHPGTCTNLVTAKGTPGTVVISKTKGLCIIQNDENRGCVECIQNPLPSCSRNIPKCPHRNVKIVKIQTGRGERLPSAEVPGGALPNQDRINSVNIRREQLSHLNIAQETERLIKKFGLLSRTLNFTIKPITEDSTDNPMQWLKKVVDELLRYTCREFEPCDLVGITLKNDNFPDRPVGISFRKYSELRSRVILDVIAVVLQSNAHFFVHDQLHIQVDRVRPPIGYGNISAVDGKTVSFSEYSMTKNSIYVIDNDDNACLATALVVAKDYCDSGYNRSVLKKFSGLKGKVFLKQRVAELCNLVGVDLNNGGHYVHIDDFQKYFCEYTIIVYDNRLGTSVYYEGPRLPNKKCLNLIMEENHFNVILSLTGAFSTQYYCNLCHVRFSRSDRHKACPYICPCCHRTPPCNISNNLINCNLCGRYFRGPHCFENHKTKLCGKLKKCRSCYKHFWITKNSKHVCGVKYCAICKCAKPIRHLCYMQPNKPSPSKAEENKHSFLFIFYDLETMQDNQIADNVYLHEPNLCVLQKACRVCILSDNAGDFCTNCGQREIIYKERPVTMLLEHIAEMSKRFNVTAIAHNMKGFDGCFILQELFNNVSRWRPEVVRTGTKLITIKCGNLIRFIDSLNFIQLPLSRFSSAFKIQGCKGYFPHYFNTRHNQNYEGPIPDKHYYGCDSMHPEERTKFITWYHEQCSNNVLFNLKEQITNYCVADVNLLRRGCLKFRECFITAYGLDPFLESLTIASACNLVFRRNFLKKDMIGIVPRNGYRCSDNQSIVAVKWLSWVAHSNNIFINHAGNGREIRLPENILVDGFCQSTNTVYEFHGCWWHGCERCFFDQTCKLSDKDDALFLRREATIEKELRIRAAGYNLITIWECDYKKLVKSSELLRNYLKTLDSDKCSPLNPRDAFYGGRTNACKLYYRCEPNEKILYYDVCSLYPFINKYGKYPIGHPVRIYVGDSECRQVNLQTVDGLIKCCVLPPQDIYHPVLPYRCNNKLVFPLCRTCAESMFQENCPHDESQRQFIGTFVADELRKPLN